MSTGQYRTVPYDIMGVLLHSVERNGYILKYCDSKEDAINQCNELNTKKTLSIQCNELTATE